MRREKTTNPIVTQNIYTYIFVVGRRRTHASGIIAFVEAITQHINNFYGTVASLATFISFLCEF